MFHKMGGFSSLLLASQERLLSGVHEWLSDHKLINDSTSVCATSSHFVRLPVAALVSGRVRPSVTDDGRSSRWSSCKVCGLVLLTSDAVWHLQVCALGSQPGYSPWVTSCVYVAANVVQEMSSVAEWCL